MYDHMQVMLGRVMTLRFADFKREDGQGTTEYAMVIGFVVVTLTLGLGALGGGITGFLTRVAGRLNGLIPAP